MKEWKGDHWLCAYNTYAMFIFNIKKTYTHSIASTNELFVKLNILKLRDIVRYKSYLFTFKAFNSKHLSTLNSLFIIKSNPYGMRSANNFVGTVCKSNIKSFNVVMIALKLWNLLANAVKRIYSYVSYKNNIKQWFWNYTLEMFMYNYTLHIIFCINTIDSHAVRYCSQCERSLISWKDLKLYIKMRQHNDCFISV